MFTALLLQKTDDGFRCDIAELAEDRLPDLAVTVAVEYSTVNYKDGLAICNGAPVVRAWPLVPGIDLAGTVEASEHPDWRPGDRVTANGWDLGEKHWGGMATKARVDGAWLTRLPESIDTRAAAAIGTAGYTAMLCVMALEDNGTGPGDGPVVVTGAAGGVGSVTVAVLAKLGYEVVASTGRADSESDYLRRLGATEIIDRSELSEPGGRPMARPRWAAGVDSVGSHTLVNLIAALEPEGCVAACGLAGGSDLPGTVYPFILRGVSLLGVNCVYQPAPRRAKAWNRLASDLDSETLESITSEVALAEVPRVAADILAGKVRGRAVVDVNA
ncbi:MAG: oxidoreductase [Acidimicrobiia bacterium]|nr:oxidoreductase [Acidimicrobiia bacterium]MYE67975.1 oxidoreductase [Acidimicrobiia bacterium]